MLHGCIKFVNSLSACLQKVVQPYLSLRSMEYSNPPAKGGNFRCSQNCYSKGSIDNNVNLGNLRRFLSHIGHRFNYNLTEIMVLEISGELQ